MVQLKQSMFSIKNMLLCRQNEKDLPTPTLVIAGKYDKLIPPVAIRIELMNDSAHIPFQKQEIEYAKEIKDFINYYLDKN